MQSFVLAISAAIILSAIVAFLAVEFVSIIWLRCILIAIVPLGFLIAALRSDRE